MLSSMRRNANPATAIAIVALVFAMSGGAFALSGGGGSGGGHATANLAKKKSKKKSSSGKPGPRGPAGATGAAGPQGPAGSAGPQGAKGDTGAAGNNGTNGTNGTSGENVTSKTVPTGNDAKCEGLGGVEYTVSGKTTLVCNGQTGFTETLPAGKTETGTWGGTGAGTPIAISFPILLSAPLDGNHTLVVGHSTSTADCPGTLANPAAAEGFLCVYETPAEEAANSIALILDPSTSSGGAATSGATLVSNFTNSEGIYGTFAVTAE